MFVQTNIRSPDDDFIVIDLVVNIDAGIFIPGG